MSATLTGPPALAPCPDPAPVAGHRRPRWALWRSPEGQPAWARPTLLAFAAVAALLYAWNIARAGYAPLYSDAVRYMSHSWKGFLYGALDSHATLDKLAGSFLPQALSARIFGYHAWSLALPQVIEGVVSVLVMYRVVRRWAGVVPGLLAAGIFTLTPIAASMFGHSMEDGALTMCLVLAADAWQRAVLEGSVRSLIWAGVWVGLGFQAKMLQAWMVLPALAAGYLVAAPGPARRRLGQLGAAGAVMLAVSLSWIALYTFTPAHDRPYVSGSTDNSAAAMVFGWNGLGRFGIKLPGTCASGPTVGTCPPGSGPVGALSPASSPAAPSPGTSSPATPGPGKSSVPGHARQTPGQPTTRQAPGQPAAPACVPSRQQPCFSIQGPAPGWAKLLGQRFGPQIGWLYPLALLTLISGLVWSRRGGRADPVRGGLVMWGTWLLSFGIVFSAMSIIPHTAYVASLAPPLAALSGAGIVMFWRAYRSGGWAGWLLPAVVAAELAWAAWLWHGYGGFLPWALWAALAIGVTAAIVLAVALLTKATRARLATLALAAGIAAMLAAPATWASSVLDVKNAGTSFNASAGPDHGNGCASVNGQPVSGGSTRTCLDPGSRPNQGTGKTSPPTVSPASTRTRP